MIEQRKAHLEYLRFFLLLTLFWGIGIYKSNGQDSTKDTSELGRIALPQSQDITSFYSYDPEQELYIFTASIADFPVGTPLILTPEEFEKRVLKAQMNAYVAIPDPSMIKDFRAARAMAGDDHDLRDVLRNYVKAKLHPDVLRKIK